MKKNLLINYSFGDKCLDSKDGDLFLESIAKFKTFEKAVFVKSISPYNISKLKTYFDYVIETDENLYTGYMAFYKWLLDRQDDYEYVMNTDLRDVIFQKDPFEFMMARPEYNLFLVAEGMKIYENDCNAMWENSYRPLLRSHNQAYDSNLVLSGGMFGGKIAHFINHCLMLFSNTNRVAQYIVQDQQVMGYLSQYYAMNPKVMITNPNFDNFCATGEAIKRNNVSVKYNGKKVTTMNDEEFYVFHQWDRTIVADKIRQEEKSESLKFFL